MQLGTEKQKQVLLRVLHGSLESNALPSQGETTQKSLRGLRSRTVSEEKPISSARDESRKIHPKVAKDRRWKLSAGKNSQFQK